MKIFPICLTWKVHY